MPTPATTDAPSAALLRHFGFSAFQPGQRPVIDAVLAGRPTVAVMPTGAGKSLCYQLPAVMSDGLTLVVSPLISLMKDQVDGLNARGIGAAAVNSHISAAEQRDALARARSGEIKLLYVAPERLALPHFVEQLGAVDLAMIAIDEAHCISQWGHDFRPDYRRLKETLRALRPRNVVACTATATPDVRDDIVASLGLESPAVFVSGFLRTNLYVDVRVHAKAAARDAGIVELLRRPEAQTGAAIVYASSRKRVEALGALLGARLGEPVVVYHAGLDGDARREGQERFMSGQARVAVATNAFGMGVDRSDVRVVVHADMPRTLEAYYQEIGRAGRDKQPAQCVLFYHPSDLRVHEFLVSQTEDPRLRAHEQRKLADMRRFVYGRYCRHRAVLDYFGERMSTECPGCDQCAPEHRLGTVSDAVPTASRPRRERAEVRAAHSTPLRDPDEGDRDRARRALAGVARAGVDVSSTKIAGMLAGEPGCGATLERLSTFGVLRELGSRGCSAVLRELVGGGLLARAGDGLRLTPDGVEVMAGRAPVTFVVPAGAVAPRAPRRERVVLSDDAGLEADARVVEALREWRLGRAAGRPAFTVCSNRTLLALAAAAPSSEREFMSVHGLGAQRWRDWGEEVIGVIASARGR
ncbi:MAG: ATP-dependent DNA helicase RecQ [Myxococcales bacterium]|nr:ATP-dependent DNA helicase RecQ [Myxococcales bacterium]MCB9520504.1 ATP-dependent DNA helicase RecQ [Myxococcales bacterium]